MVVWPRLARNCGLSVSRPLSQGFFAVFEKREAELRTLEEKKHNEEVAFSKHLKQQMESIFAPSAAVFRLIASLLRA